MSLIRKIEITNFRSIQKLSWQPSLGINCLIGPGDTGKSSILDAIDFCLGARRNIQITDTDFYNLDVDTPIQITITLGRLDDSLKNIDAYGLYLHGLNLQTGEISEEPSFDLETVLTIHLAIGADLEPDWTLLSKRAEAQGLSRNLNWSDRARLAPTRLGAVTGHNLSWRHGSILNRISEERADVSAVLFKAARNVRTTFGNQAKDQLSETLDTITRTAKSLGIPVGSEVKAMLDAHSASFSGGTISLHDERGVPLRGLGLGSMRLLIAGLQRYVAKQASIILVDELEHGLEPHRIMRLLDALGAKEKNPPLQVFMTTHSPVAVRELSGNQICMIRRLDDHHEARFVGVSDEIQGTIRSYPGALLAPSIIVCEGASEVGLLRGLDQYRICQGEQSITAHGVAIVDGTGTSIFKRALAFKSLGYRIAVLRDSDVDLAPEPETEFKKLGGTIVAWREKRKIEEELFLSISENDVKALIVEAIRLKGESLVDDHIKSFSKNQYNLKSVQNSITPETREILGKTAGNKKGWFKTVSAMEAVAREIIGPGLPDADIGFRAIIDGIFSWVEDAEQRN